MSSVETKAYNSAYTIYLKFGSKYNKGALPLQRRCIRHNNLKLYYVSCRIQFSLWWKLFLNKAFHVEHKYLHFDKKQHRIYIQTNSKSFTPPLLQKNIN